MQSNQVTPSSGTSFEITPRGYAPAAVESSISRLVAELGALRTQASALEIEIGAVGCTRLAGEADALAALDRAESMLRQAYADARATTAAAAAEAEQARAVARAEVAAELHQLDVEIAEVNETAVKSGARMVALARKRAADRVAREDGEIERAHEWAELIVTRARTRATACATAAVREINAQKQIDDRTIAAERRRALEAAVAQLRAEARRFDADAATQAAQLRAEATAQADAVVAEVAGATARLEAETDFAMAELTDSMELLKAELAKLHSPAAPAKPAPAARAARAKSATAPAEPKPPATTAAAPRTLKAPAPKAPAAKAAATEPPAAKPAAAKAATKPAATKPAAAAKPAAKPATRKPAAARAVEPVAARPVVAPVVEPTPIAPVPAPVPLAPVAAAAITPTRITLSTAPVVVPATQQRPAHPLVVGGTARPAEPKEKTDGPGFVRLTPAPGAPVRRVVPAAVPASAAMVARRARRLATSAAAPSPEAPKLSLPVAGGPSCVSAATTTTSAVTVLRTVRPHS